MPDDERDKFGAVTGPDRAGPRLLYQKVPEAKAVKNRVGDDARPGGERVLPAVTQRLLPVCPSENRPGCGNTHSPCGWLPTGISARITPVAVSNT